MVGVVGEGVKSKRFKYSSHRVIPNFKKTSYNKKNGATWRYLPQWYPKLRNEPVIFHNNITFDVSKNY